MRGQGDGETWRQGDLETGRNETHGRKRIMSGESKSMAAAGYAIFRGENGYPKEKARALETLEVGKAYRVTGGEQYSSITCIELEGISGVWNTALFDCDLETLPIERMGGAAELPEGRPALTNGALALEGE
jgi:hypothetical protein